MFEKMTYDPIKDLAPITQVYRYPNVLDPRRYQHAARSIDEIGRLVGGWQKAHGACGGEVEAPYAEAAR
jgi:hypothetical protein